MFASCTPSSVGVVKANDEDGVVDIRDILGKCGRDTNADKPAIIVTEKTKEKMNKGESHCINEEVKYVTHETDTKTLVLDSRAFFLQKISVDDLCKDRSAEDGQKHENVEFMTCNDVLDELRDEKTRQYMQNLPFELKMQEPNESAMKFVVKFSKETGDFQGLSQTDLKVMALAYFMVQSKGETKYCRKSPPDLQEFKPKWTAPKKDQKQEIPEDLEIDEDEGWEVKKEKAKPKKKFKRNIKRDFYPEAFLKDLNSDPKEPVKQENEKNNTDEQKNQPTTTPSEKTVETATDGSSQEDGPAPEDHFKSPNNQEDNEEPVLDIDDKDDILVQKETEDTNDDSQEEDEDCDDEWITPDNLDLFLTSNNTQGDVEEGKEDESSNISVEVVTSDFAMQNVLMQIGIPVVSLEGVEIKKIKKFKLRCEGCKTINKKIDIEYCEKCGGHTLAKVSVFLNSNGEITFFKGKRLRKNNRGTQFDIPKPKHGRDKNAMILREDQLWVGQNKIRMKENQREDEKIKNKIGNHFNDLVSFENTRKKEKKFTTDLVYGHGKQNPNIPKKKYSKKKRK